MTPTAGFALLDIVALKRDLPQHGLKRGDIGTLVELYEPDGVEVEFVAPSGRTQAVVTLKVDDVRAIAENDLLTVRQVALTACRWPKAQCGRADRGLLRA